MKVLMAAACLAAMTAGTAMAAETGYNPREAFAPRPMTQAVNRYRSANGLPGPDYWQNRADYDIHAVLETKTPSLSGEEVITYTNNSPDTLDVLWLQLDQNLYRKDSRGAHAAGDAQAGETSGGYTLDSVEIFDGKAFVAAQTLVDDTRLRVTLPRPLGGGGAQVRVRIRWRFDIPGEWGGRMAWGKAKDGPIYDLAQWYPRMAVYDDIRGWDTLPYLAQEFYLEYGDFDYAVNVPADMLVAGSGELMNAKEVLTPRELQRFERAKTSGATVMIRSPDEIRDPATRPASKDGRLTWRFHMSHTRDVAFAASAVFAWDAAKIDLPGGKTAMAMSFYPAESQGRDRWGRSTEYVKDAVENFSKRWYSYPWPAAINIA
ncbi:MAG TPA: M1 family peptidase, partial [Asticcacaulis sp.]